MLKSRYEKFITSQYGDEISYKQFSKSSQNIVKNIQSLGKRHSDQKKEILKVFSANNWENLILNKKEKHSLFDCDGCLKDKQFKETLEFFLVTTQSLTNTKKAKQVLFKDKILSDVTNNVLNDLDERFSVEHNIYKTNEENVF